MEPTPIETRQTLDSPTTLEAQNARAGALALLALLFAFPLLLAYLFAAYALAFAAWHMMIAQLS